jgi:hypothetical protein
MLAFVIFLPSVTLAGEVRSLPRGSFELPSTTRPGDSMTYLFTTPVLKRSFPHPLTNLEPLAKLIDDNFERFLQQSLQTPEARKYYATGEKAPGERGNAFFSWYVRGNRFLQEPQNWPAVSAASEFIEDSVKEYIRGIGRTTDVKRLSRRELLVSFTPMWPVVQHSATVHPPHNHTSNAVVGVLFLRDGTDSPTLRLYDPRPQAIHWDLEPEAPPLVAEIPCVKGNVVLFPAWLTHSVERQSGQGDVKGVSSSRLTLSFNIQLHAPGVELDTSNHPCLDCNVAVSVSAVGARGKPTTNREL